jgi:hypothetical protein
MRYVAQSPPAAAIAPGTVDHAGWVVTLGSPERHEFYGPTLEEALGWCLVWLMVPEIGAGPFRVCADTDPMAATSSAAGEPTPDIVRVRCPVSASPILGMPGQLRGARMALSAVRPHPPTSSPMDDSHFDSLARSLGTAGSRRRAVGGLLLGALGLRNGGSAEDAAAHDLTDKCKKKSSEAKKKCLKKAKKHAATHANETLPPPPPPPNVCQGQADGRACGTCQACRSGVCGAMPDDTLCLDEDLGGGHCVSGTCVSGSVSCEGKPDTTVCDPGKQCSGEVCGTPPAAGTCQHERLNDTFGGWLCINHQDCCSDFCQVTFSCARGSGGQPCRDGTDCLSNRCIGFVCQ